MMEMGHGQGRGSVGKAQSSIATTRTDWESVEHNTEEGKGL